MGSKTLKLVIGICLIIAGEVAIAKTIYFGSGVETVPVVYGGQTILRFEEAVKTISNAGDFIRGCPQVS